MRLRLTTLRQPCRPMLQTRCGYRPDERLAWPSALPEAAVAPLAGLARSPAAGRAIARAGTRAAAVCLSGALRDPCRGPERAPAIAALLRRGIAALGATLLRRDRHARATAAWRSAAFVPRHRCRPLYLLPGAPPGHGTALGTPLRAAATKRSQRPAASQPRRRLAAGRSDHGRRASSLAAAGGIGRSGRGARPHPCSVGRSPRR